MWFIVPVIQELAGLARDSAKVRERRGGTMNVERSRITLLAGLAALCLSGRPTSAWADAPPTVTVYKNPT
jgi:hypothetical protein